MQDYNSKHRIDVAKKLNSPEHFCPFPVYLDANTSRYHSLHFFSVSPGSNPSSCLVSPSIKSLFAIEIFYHWMFIWLLNSHEWPRQNFSKWWWRGWCWLMMVICWQWCWRWFFKIYLFRINVTNLFSISSFKKYLHNTVFATSLLPPIQVLIITLMCYCIHQ